MNDWNDAGSGMSQPNIFVRGIRRVGRWLRNLFAVIGFFYTVVPLVLIWFFIQQMQPAHRSSGAGGASDGPKTLWLMLDVPILEAQPNMSEALLKEFLGESQGIYLPDIRSSLRSAATDSDIKDLAIVIDGLQASMADLEELRQIILEFRETSKKPVHTWLHHLDNAALIISSATDMVSLAPVAEVFIPGPAFPQIYAGEAIRKVGVDLQVVRAGKFKSAFEAFISNEPSAESKEMMGSLESSLRNHMVKAISEGRKKQENESFLWLKESVFTAAKAKELGIVDELAYIPPVNFDTDNAILLQDYGPGQGENSGKKGYSLTAEKSLALIEASGEISSASSDGSGITPDSITEELEWARTNKDIAAVVLRVSSPGGSASASDEIWEYVRRLNAEKPVIASFGSVAASGGYYISAAATKIVANPSTITGSIGVIGMIPNFEPFKDKYGITFPITTQSNRAAMLSGGKKMTPEDHKYIGDSIDETYRIFKSRVSEGRKIPIEKVEALAQGRVYSGMQALELGLVDQLGTLKDAFQVAKKEAGLDETKLYPVLRYEGHQLSLSECFSSVSKMKRCFRKRGAQLRVAARDFLLSEDEKVLTQLSKAKQILSKERVLTLYTSGTPQ